MVGGFDGDPGKVGQDSGGHLVGALLAKADGFLWGKEWSSRYCVLVGTELHSYRSLSSAIETEKEEGSSVTVTEFTVSVNTEGGKYDCVLELKRDGKDENVTLLRPQAEVEKERGILMMQIWEAAIKLEQLRAKLRPELRDLNAQTAALDAEHIESPRSLDTTLLIYLYCHRYVAL